MWFHRFDLHQTNLILPSQLIKRALKRFKLFLKINNLSDDEGNLPCEIFSFEYISFIQNSFQLFCC